MVDRPRYTQMQNKVEKFDNKLKMLQEKLTELDHRKTMKELYTNVLSLG